MRAVRISTDALRAAKLSLSVIYAADANGWARALLAAKFLDFSVEILAKACAASYTTRASARFYMR